MDEYDRGINSHVTRIRRVYQSFDNSTDLLGTWWENYKIISRTIQKEEAGDLSDLLYLTLAFLEVGVEDFGEENEEVRKLETILRKKSELVRERERVLMKRKTRSLCRDAKISEWKPNVEKDDDTEKPGRDTVVKTRYSKREFVYSPTSGPDDGIEIRAGRWKSFETTTVNFFPWFYAVETGEMIPLVTNTILERERDYVEANCVPKTLAEHSVLTGTASRDVRVNGSMAASEMFRMVERRYRAAANSS